MQEKIIRLVMVLDQEARHQPAVGFKESGLQYVAFLYPGEDFGLGDHTPEDVREFSTFLPTTRELDQLQSRPEYTKRFKAARDRLLENEPESGLLINNSEFVLAEIMDLDGKKYVVVVKEGSENHVGIFAFLRPSEFEDGTRRIGKSYIFQIETWREMAQYASPFFISEFDTAVEKLREALEKDS